MTGRIAAPRLAWHPIPMQKPPVHVEMLFPTLIYRTAIAGAGRLNHDLEQAAYALAENDRAGQRWCAKHGYAGYTSYGSLADLPARTRPFARLKRHIERHAARFARELHWDLRGGKPVCDTMWVNVLPEGGSHSSHIHTNAVLSARGRLLLGLMAGVAAAAAMAKHSQLTGFGAPMRFAIVRSNVEGCEPNCPQWISAEGAITQETPALLRKILKQAGKDRLPVLINSVGGDVDASLAMGDIIRANRLDVGVGWTFFAGCMPTSLACKLPEQQRGVYRG